MFNMVNYVIYVIYLFFSRVINLKSNLPTSQRSVSRAIAGSRWEVCRPPTTSQTSHLYIRTVKKKARFRGLVVINGG